MYRAVFGYSGPMLAGSDSPAALEQRLTDALLAFERLDDAWPKVFRYSQIKSRAIYSNREELNRQKDIETDRN